MKTMIATMLLGVMACAGAAWAEEAEQAAQAKCQVAEVNPVTGSVMCIKPLGAPVEPPPTEASVPCKPNDRADQAWSWGPKCGEALRIPAGPSKTEAITLPPSAPAPPIDQAATLGRDDTMPQSAGDAARATAAFMAFAQGRTFSYVRKDIGAIWPGR